MFAPLRKYSGIIIIITAIAFIAGMALMGMGDIFKQSSYIGKIGGKKIFIQEFAKKLEEYSYNYSQQTETEINEQILVYLNNNLWNEMVQEVVIQKALKEYKIVITDEQIIDRIKNDPPKEITNQEVFHTDGVFDQQKYLDILKNGGIDLNALEAYYKRTMPIELLQERIMQGATIAEEDIRQKFIELNEKADAKIIWFNANNLTQNVEVSDNEINEYYVTNRDKEFKKGATRVVQYTSIPLVPSKADEKNAKEASKK